MKKAKHFWRSLLIILVLCWVILLAFDAMRLIGSTDPGKYPTLYVSSELVQDEYAKYNSLGFTQYYRLGREGEFLYGEFRIFGLKVAQWDS